jgi:hypothetical protein
LRFVAVTSADFLRVLRIPILRGRDFELADAAAGGAVILDEVAAKRLWPTGDPLGHLVKLGSADSQEPWLPVVGVAGPARMFFDDDPDLAAEPMVYVLQPHDTTSTRRLVVRVAAGVESAVALRLSRTLSETSPTTSYPRLELWIGWFYDIVAARRFIAQVFLLFATFALANAILGLYSVVRYSVEQRRREFGIRAALGATSSQLLRAVLRLLYGIPPTDVVSLLAGQAVLWCAAILASLRPMDQARRVDPASVLRAI